MEPNYAQPKTLQDNYLANYLFTFHKYFGMILANKASNNIYIVLEKYYIQIIINELGIFSDTGNKTYSC